MAIHRDKMQMVVIYCLLASKRKFEEKQVEEWWKCNKERVLKNYPPLQPAHLSKYPAKKIGGDVEGVPRFSSVACLIKRFSWTDQKLRIRNKLSQLLWLQI